MLTIEKKVLKNKINDISLIEDFHGFLIDLSYDEWLGNEKYLEMIRVINKKYGELVGFGILIGNFNSQVCNGGHTQYYYNGYSNIGGGIDSVHTKDTEAHDMLIEFLKKDRKLKSYSWYNKLMDILVRFKKFEIDTNETEIHTCSECGGTGDVEMCVGKDEEGEEIYENESCSECGGSGEIEEINDYYGEPYNHEWEDLDTEYYLINDKIMDDLEEYFKQKIK